MQIPFISNLTIKNKILIATVAALVVNATIFYFIILTSLNQIASAHNDILNLKIDSENKITREKNINDLNQKIKKIEPQLEKINNTFISQNRELEFITALEGLESKNNVQQNLNIDLNKPEKSEVFSKVPVSIAVTGTFSNLMNYLANLESLSYFISIASLSFGNANSGGTISRPGEIDRNEINRNTDMTMSLNGYSYWR